MVHVYEISNVEVEKISIKKPFAYDHVKRVYFDIYLNNNPLLLVTNRLQVYSKGLFTLKFIQNKNNGCLLKLDTILRGLLERIKKNPNYAESVRNKEFNTTIYEHSDSINMILSVHAMGFSEMVCFDTSGGVMNMSQINMCDNARLIIYLKSVWLGDNSIGVNMKICQLQRVEPLNILRSLFIPPPPPLPRTSAMTCVFTNTPDGSSNEKKNTFEISKNIKSIPTLTRPSLTDIIASKNKLRKTNILC